MITGTGTIFLGDKGTPDVESLLRDCTSRFVLSQDRRIEDKQSKNFTSGTRIRNSGFQSYNEWTLTINTDVVDMEVFKNLFSIVDTGLDSSLRELNLLQPFNVAITEFYNETDQSPDEVTGGSGDLISYLSSTQDVVCYGAGTDIACLSFFGIVYQDGSPGYTVYLPEIAPTRGLDYSFGREDLIEVRFLMTGRPYPIIRPIT